MKPIKFDLKHFIYIPIFIILSGNLDAIAKEFNPMSVEEQVKTIKQEMVDLGKDIVVLEDILLYSVNSRISVYLTADSGNYFKIDNIKLLVNDEVVNTYQYNDREKLGFSKGSAQRIYIGNVKPGKNKLVAFVEGIGPKGRRYKRGASIIFEKKEKAQTFELLIEDNEKKQNPQFSIKEYS